MKFFSNIKLNLDSCTILFVILLFISFLSTSSFRTHHYQELDSRLAYNLLQHDPSRVAKYVSGTYFKVDPNDTSISDPFFRLTDIIESSPDWILLELQGKPFFEEAVRVYNKDAPYPETAKQIKQFINKILELRPHIKDIPAWGVYRIMLSNFFNSLGLNTATESALDYPLASTYSFGSGIIYSITNSLADDYATFFSFSTLLTQLLTHLSVLFLFLTLVNIGISTFYSALASILSLFSLSLYSYGFHLGSSTYALFTFSLFFLCSSSFTRNKYYFPKLGVLGGFLIFLNTLMAIPIFSLMTAHFIELMRKGKISSFNFKKIILIFFTLLNKQKIGITLTFVFLVLFFQPGQGPRGQVSVSYIIPQIYYSFLNLTGWFNDYGHISDVIQASLFFILIFFGIYALIQTKDLLFLRKNNFYSLIGISLLFYAFLLMAGSLNFSPSRHILFLKVFFTYFYAFGLFFLLKNVDFLNKKKIQLFLLFSISIVGLIHHQNRFEQMLDPMHEFELPKDIDFVVSPIPDGFDNTLPIPVINIKSFEFVAAPEVNILYLSQITDFNEWLISSDLSEKQINSIVNIEVVSKISDEYSFMPFTPELSRINFAFNRGNGLYAYKFQIKPHKNSLTNQ